MNIVTLPLPTELLYANSTNECELYKDYIIDISAINYEDPEMDSDKVNYSLIYLRNIDLPIPCDFSKLSYNEKEEWLLKYINSNLFDLSIKELNETILNLLSDDKIDNMLSILTDDELNTFKENNSKLLNDIKQFIVSLELLINYAVNKDSTTEYINNDYPTIEEKPLFFETVHQLIKHYPVIVDSLHLYYSNQYSLCNYTYLYHNIEKSSAFYLDFLNLPSIKFIGLLLNDELVNKEITNE